LAQAILVPVQGQRSRRIALHFPLCQHFRRDRMAVCMKLSSCVLVAVLSVVGAQDCSLPGDRYSKGYSKGYDISECQAWWPNKLSVQECNVKCNGAEHYGGSPKVSCVWNGAGYMFHFGGCTLNDTCKLPASTTGYDLSKSSRRSRTAISRPMNARCLASPTTGTGACPPRASCPRELPSWAHGT